MKIFTKIKNQVKQTTNNRKNKNLIVLSTQQISKNLKRIVFDDTSNTMTTDDESGYLKLQFEQDGETVLRSYTILEVTQKDGKNLATIDFVTHEGGFGAEWAKHAKVGDTIDARGPGPAKLADTFLDWFVFMGDLTALPAITANLKKLPADAKGYAIIEILDESDILDIQKPDGIEIDWLVNSTITDSAKIMLTTIQNKTWLHGTPYVWVASEFNTAITLRKFFRQEKSIERKQSYFSSYWKYGESDEGNKRAKQNDGKF